MQMRCFRHAVLAAVMLLASTGAGAVTLELVPSATTVSPGGSVDIDVVISGLGDFASPSVGAFDLVVLFDPAVFTYNGLAFGPFLGDAMAAEALTTTVPGASDVNAVEISLLPAMTLDGLQPSSFTLFTVTFDAAAAGTGVFDATSNALGDESGLPLVIDAIVPTTVTASNLVEIPTLSGWSMILLSLLLFAAAVLRLRRVQG